MKSYKNEQGKSTGINPFELEAETRENGNTQFLNIHDKIAEIRALLATICRNYGRALTGTEIYKVIFFICYSDLDLAEVCTKK